MIFSGFCSMLTEDCEKGMHTENELWEVRAMGVTMTLSHLFVWSLMHDGYLMVNVIIWKSLGIQHTCFLSWWS